MIVRAKKASFCLHSASSNDTSSKNLLSISARNFDLVAKTAMCESNLCQKITLYRVAHSRYICPQGFGVPGYVLLALFGTWELVLKQLKVSKDFICSFYKVHGSIFSKLWSRRLPKKTDMHFLDWPNEY